MYQAVGWGPNRWGNPVEVWFHPTFWLFFGYYTRTEILGDIPMFPRTLHLGWDIWNDMLSKNQMPHWPENSRGSPYLEHMGIIKMKPPAFDKWFGGCFQTGPVWIGSPTPGRGSRAKRRAKGKGIGK